MLSPLKRVWFRLAYLSPLGVLGFSGPLRPQEQRPHDMWAGDPLVGKYLLSGQYMLAGQLLAMDKKIAWDHPTASDRWRAALHNFSWLRDVWAFNQTKASAKLVRERIEDWLRCSKTHPVCATSAEVTGERLQHFICHAKFILAGAGLPFRRKWLAEIARAALQQEMLLRHTEPSAPTPSIQSVSGVFHVAAALPYAGFLHHTALSALEQWCKEALPRDAMVQSRTPSEQYRALRTLLDIRQIFVRQAIEIPRFLEDTIRHMAVALRYLRHGDGRLALFQSGLCEDARWIAAVLDQAGGQELLPPAQGVAGYIRLERSHTAVMMDTAIPRRASHAAGTLAIEISDGRERLITSCGGYTGSDPGWIEATRQAAAYSTISFIRSRGGAQARPAAMEVTSLFAESEGHQTAEAVIRNYGGVEGLSVARQCYLDRRGVVLMGSDLFSRQEGAGPLPPHVVTLRFHVHPEITPVILAPGQIGLFTGSGAEWEFTCSRLEQTELEDSVFLGRTGRPEPAQQIVIQIPLPQDGDLLVEWAFRKVR